MQIVIVVVADTTAEQAEDWEDVAAMRIPAEVTIVIAAMIGGIEEDMIVETAGGDMIGGTGIMTETEDMVVIVQLVVVAGATIATIVLDRPLVTGQDAQDYTLCLMVRFVIPE